MLEFQTCGGCGRPLDPQMGWQHALDCDGVSVEPVGAMPDDEQRRIEAILESAGCQRIAGAGKLFSAWRKADSYAPDAKWFVGPQGQIRLGRSLSASARCSEAELQGWITAMRSGVVAG